MKYVSKGAVAIRIRNGRQVLQLPLAQVPLAQVLLECLNDDGDRNITLEVAVDIVKAHKTKATDVDDDECEDGEDADAIDIQ